jgi:hypothetical protein
MRGLEDCKPSKILAFRLAVDGAGGLEGCEPSKNHLFLVLVAGLAGNEHEKIEISGRPGTHTQRVPGASPNPSTE